MNPTGTPLTFSAWSNALADRGLTVLPASHAVPVELWIRDRAQVLHLSARGTTVVLRRYTTADLTGLILRSECDCEEHRVAGAGRRTVLTPGAVPSAEVRIDGREEFGWSTIEAGLLDVPTAAVLLDRLLTALPVEGKARNLMFPGLPMLGDAG